MTAHDIERIAREMGASGRAWNDFASDDATQDFVTTHDNAPDAYVETWKAAFNVGEVEYLTAQGWISQWTTAPDDYDCFGTVTAEQCGDWHGKPLRRILSHPHHAGYQASRNSSGNHPTWSVDPRIEEREATERRERWQLEDAARATRRETGLAWLATASEDEIEEAKERDEVESRGLKYVELRDEIKRREAVLAETERAAEWDRCRAAFEDGVIIVDEGTPGYRGTWGWVAGRPTHIYYGVRLTGDWRKVADEAVVEGASRDNAGSLAMVADSLACGRMRVVAENDVPPEPVVRRIGHERWKTIVRAEVAGRVVWVGRVSSWSEPLVLDSAGKIVRAKGARSAALAAYVDAGAP